MSKHKENAEIGNEIERGFVSLLKKNKDLIEKIKNQYKIKENFSEAHPTGRNQKKSDVLLLFNNYSMGVNIKAGKTNFNQITRLWLDKFIEVISLSNKCKEVIQNGIDNHRLKRNKIFIEEKYFEILKKEFEPNLKKIIEYIFKGLNNNIVKLLVLYNRNKKYYFIYDIDSVIDLFSKNIITFSKNGIIKIGDFITLQRKGGNGIACKIPKSDLKHPGNQIQFKMKILSFMDKNKPLFILK